MSARLRLLLFLLPLPSAPPCFAASCAMPRGVKGERGVRGPVHNQ